MQLKSAKIVVCINSLDMGGAERVVVTLINYLSQQLPIYLVCLEQSMVYPIDDAIPVYQLSRMTGKESNLWKLLMLPVLALRLKRFCRKYHVSVVQSHLSRANYVNLLARLMGGIYTTHIVIHGIAGEYEKKGIKGKINLLIIKKLYKKANRIFVNSQGVENDLATYLGKRKEIEVIANPFNFQAILDQCGEKMEPSEFQFAAGVDYIITIGRLVASKRHIDLLMAFEAVAAAIHNCQLLVLGEGEEQAKLEAYIRAHNLTAKVHLLGRVANPYKYLYRSRLFISASESESFGNVLIEAMACSCPVIAADCPYGPREILAPDSDPSQRNTGRLEESVYGILVPVHKPKILAAAMIKMLTNEKIQQHYVQQAVYYCQRYDIEKIGKLYKERLIEDSPAA